MKGKQNSRYLVSVPTYIRKKRCCLLSTFDVFFGLVAVGCGGACSPTNRTRRLILSAVAALIYRAELRVCMYVLATTKIIMKYSRSGTY